jgi:glycosyltransferase involved in cell wall biosynthesis
MNVIYISVFTDGTGYSQAACETALALDAAGATVSCGDCSFVGGHPTPAGMEKLLGRRLEHCDVLIQHLPPPLMSYCGEAGLNVGVFYGETHPLPQSWVRRANTMDVVVASSTKNAWRMHESGVRNVRAAPVPCDTTRYERSVKPLELLKPLKDQGLFLFYTVCEVSKRKNLEGLLRAFYAEFRPEEPVRLVLKASVPGLPPDQSTRAVEQLLADVRAQCGLRRPPQELVLSGRLTDDQVLGLHAAGDVYVSASYAEGWNLPAFDAMAMGRTPVVTDCGGPGAFIDAGTGWLVPTRPEPVYGERSAFPELFTGRALWDAPDLTELRRAMRAAYAHKDSRQDKAARGLERAYRFSRPLAGRPAAGGPS